LSPLPAEELSPVEADEDADGADAAAASPAADGAEAAPGEDSELDVAPALVLEAPPAAADGAEPVDASPAADGDEAPVVLLVEVEPCVALDPCWAEPDEDESLESLLESLLVSPTPGGSPIACERAEPGSVVVLGVEFVEVLVLVTPQLPTLTPTVVDETVWPGVALTVLPDWLLPACMPEVAVPPVEVALE